MATPQENPALTAELQRLAESHVASAATRFGLTLDYSEESLRQTDDAISKELAAGNSLEDSLLAHGAYVGETLRRRLGGVWVQDERGVALLQGIGGGDLTASPFSWMQSRLANGMGDALAARFSALQQQLSPAAGNPAGPARVSLARPAGAASATASGPSAEELAMLTRSPLLIFLLVAAADGKVDKKEFNEFQKVIVGVMTNATPLLRDAMSRLLPRMEQTFDELEDINPGEELERLAVVLDTHYPKEAKAFKQQLVSIAVSIAESSGGFLGFGSKISNDEKTAIAGIAVTLGLIEGN